MTYEEELKNPKWTAKRRSILKRDQNICHNCNNKSYYDIENIVVETVEEFGYLRSFTVEDADPIEYCIHRVNFQTQEHSSCLGFIYSDTKLEDFVEKNDYQVVGRHLGKFKSNSITLEELLNAILGKSIHTNEQEYQIFGLINETNDNWIYVRDLHVHHRYYKKGYKAWEYPESALITLCWSCHELLHKNNTVPVLNEKDEIIGEMNYCYRCHGAGHFPEYSHVKKGICFRCKGAKFEEYLE